MALINNYKQILTLALLLCTMMQTWGATWTDNNGVTWSYKVSNSKAMITGSSQKTEDLSIPSTVNGYAVATIGRSAFWGYTGLTSVTIPSSVTTIGDYAFSGCTGLTSVTISEEITSIGNYAFQDCVSLTSVAIPRGVTNIGNRAFGGCTDLTSVSIPEGVMTIGGSAFENTPFYDNQEDGLIYIGNIVYKYKGTMPANTEIIIRNGTVSISGDAFSECTGLTKVTIPEGVTSIGRYAFYHCSGLTSVTIPKGVTSIGECAFYRCTGLTSVTIPESITTIGEEAFNLVYIGNVAYKYKGKMPADTKIAIRDGTVSISSDAFINCTGLTSVTIPDGVTHIGERALNCTGLTSVTIPTSVTNIGLCAFWCCTSLTEVTIHEGVKCIGYWAFDGCTRLKKVITPDIAAWCAISFDSADANPLFYAKNLYSNYTKITDLVIPEGVTGVGDWAFYNCTGLTSLTMSDGVTNIGDKAFYGCTGLTNATFPSSMTSIGDEAFYGCTGLKNVICNIETPLSISVGTFSHRANATLYVPAGTKDAYETADYWKDFKEIVEMEPVPNEDTTGINSLTPGSPSTGRGSGYYTLDGLKLGEKPTKKGTYVVNGQKVMVR